MDSVAVALGLLLGVTALLTIIGVVMLGLLLSEIAELRGTIRTKCRCMKINDNEEE